MSSDPAHNIPVDALGPDPAEATPAPSPAQPLVHPVEHPAVQEVSGPITSPTVAPHARRMLDRYEIIAEIAKGGMGTVYLARLEGAGGFERLMAIKLMHEHLAEEEQFVTMLLDEARTAASIHHPNAVGIVDVCASPVGYYLVMNYVDGFSLWQVMTHPKLDDRERIRITTRMIADSLHGLHAAHTAKNAKGERLGIVHRDVSPQNVIVGTDGMGRIVDFGIALAASRVATSRPGMLKGKPSYMAPEQARGDACDGRTDVFAMGIVLWESLVNERLFWAEMDVAVLMQVMDCNIERPDARRPHIPAALADVAMKALARSPGDRYATARDFAVALEKAAEAAGLLATTHEVEDRLSEIFADEMADKQRAIGGHLSASSGSPVLLQKGQLGTIPRLIARKPATRDLATRASGVRSRGSGPISGQDVALAQTSTATPSQSPPASTRVVPLEPSVIVADQTTSPATTSATTSSSTNKIALALGIVGVILTIAALGVYFAGGSTETPVATPTPRPEPIVAPQPTTEPNVPPATAVAAPTTEATLPTGVDPLPPSVEPTTAEAMPSEPATTMTPSARGSRGSRGTSMQTQTATPPVTQEPATTMQGTSPALESNPYLTH
ncbi:MAG: protein kinase [Deltaproteobacteria bacterium]|nr:protein kinase [Deltaproteobacteria bacterium]